jgi:hypothetical protein
VGTLDEPITSFLCVNSRGDEKCKTHGIGRDLEKLRLLLVAKLKLPTTQNIKENLAEAWLA